MNPNEQALRDLIVAAKLEASAAAQEAMDAVCWANRSDQIRASERAYEARCSALSAHALLEKFLLKFDAARADK